jgi:hypothetical protein
MKRKVENEGYKCRIAAETNSAEIYFALLTLPLNKGAVNADIRFKNSICRSAERYY